MVVESYEATGHASPPHTLTVGGESDPAAKPVPVSVNVSFSAALVGEAPVSVGVRSGVKAKLHGNDPVVDRLASGIR